MLIYQFYDLKILNIFIHNHYFLNLDIKIIISIDLLNMDE
jgi:hypothetical protein